MLSQNGGSTSATVNMHTDSWVGNHCHLCCPNGRSLDFRTFSYQRSYSFLAAHFLSCLHAPDACPNLNPSSSFLSMKEAFVISDQVLVSAVLMTCASKSSEEYGSPAHSNSLCEESRAGDTPPLFPLSSSPFGVVTIHAWCLSLSQPPRIPRIPSISSSTSSERHERSQSAPHGDACLFACSLSLFLP